MAGKAVFWERTELLFLFLLTACTTLSYCVVPCAAIYVAHVPCGGTVPINSQFIFDPVWSISPYRNRIRDASNANLTVQKESLSPSIVSIVKAETGMNPGAVTLFVLGSDPGLQTSSDSNNAPAESVTGDSCVLRVNPLLAAMAGTETTVARLVFLAVEEATTGMCANQIEVSIHAEGVTRAIALQKGDSSQETIFARTAVIGGEDGAIAWPIILSFPESCRLSVLVLTDNRGRINEWYVWIPTTVYTAVVTALIVPIIGFGRKVPGGFLALQILAVFGGYVGSCIGLVIELINWESAVGRMFPFPPAVTLYTCLVVLYALYLLPLVYRQGHNRVVLMGVLRLLVYGMNCALCVGYWTCGYVLLGSLALFQYVATNFVLTLYFALISVRLRNVTFDEGSVRFTHTFVYVWFAPVTPFAVCLLWYFDLFVISRYGTLKKPSDARLRDVVYVYNAQMSIPLMLLQNVFGIALIAAATAFHMPFIVILFAALWLFSLHVVYSIDVYVQQYQHWRRQGNIDLITFTRCGWLSLSPVMDFLLKKDSCMERHTSRATSRPATNLDALTENRDSHANYLSPQRTAGGPHSAGELSDRRLSSSTQRMRSRGSVAFLDNGDPVYFPPVLTTNVNDFATPRSCTSSETPASHQGSTSSSGHHITTPIDPSAGGPQFWPTTVEK